MNVKMRQLTKLSPPDKAVHTQTMCIWLIQMQIQDVQESHES